MVGPQRLQLCQKQSNLSPVKPLNLAVSFQEKQRTEENAELLLSAPLTRLNLWEILYVKQPRFFNR